MPHARYIEQKSTFPWSVFVHHLEMSVFLPFRNVTVVRFGRRAGAEPCEAQRPTGDRRTDPRPAPIILPSGRQLARLVDSSADFEQTSVGLIAAAWRLRAARSARAICCSRIWRETAPRCLFSTIAACETCRSLSKVV